MTTAPEAPMTTAPEAPMTTAPEAPMTAPTSLPAGHAPAPRLGGPSVPRWWAEAGVAVTWGSLLVVTALWVAHGGIGGVHTLADAFTSSGRLTGLLGSDLLLIQVLLMARIPFVEKAFGQDELARTHRLVGFGSFTLMVAHVVLIVLGYAGARLASVVPTFVDLVVGYPAMLIALLGTLALCLVVATSIRAARRRLRYESWHLIHLYAYLGCFLALPHQLWTGADFLASPLATAYWWGLWGAAAGSVVLFRLGLPAWRTLRHRLVVSDVRTSGDVTTVTMTGRDLDRLPVAGGQFFQWRFLDGPGWTRAHPYSLSAAPNGHSLQIAVAHVGDGTTRLRALRPGTKVLIEGPYGRLHAGTRTRRGVLLLAAGIGIAPMKALLESLHQQAGDVTLVYRVSREKDAPLLRDVAQSAARVGARLIVLEGPRIGTRPSWLPQSWAHVDDARALRHICPDLVHRDVYLCGGSAWMDAAEAALTRAGVDRRHIHTERFAY